VGTDLKTGSGQINFLVPSTEIPGEVKVQVVRQGIHGPAITISLVDAAPALFPAGNYAIAQFPSYALVSPDNPAHAGDTIVLYLTGLGHTQPNPNPGEIPPTPANAVASVQVLLNGAPVDRSLIKYAGITPQSTGLYQINFVVPPGVPVDPEIRVSAAGQTSQPGIKLAVR
jgi:uncharacterized protein (TIGR03437 family)